MAWYWVLPFTFTMNDFQDYPIKPFKIQFVVAAVAAVKCVYKQFLVSNI